MGAFDDLIPAAPAGTGAFDDLIPEPPATGAFDDLVPAQPQFAHRDPRMVSATAGGPQLRDAGAPGAGLGLRKNVWQGILDAPGALTEPLVKVSEPLQLDPQTVADAMDVVKGAGAAAVAHTYGVDPGKEFVRVAGEKSRTPTTTEKAFAGANNAVTTSLDFFTSPLGVATLGTGGLPKMTQRAIAAAFALDMGRQVPHIATALGEELAKPEGQRDTEKISNLITSGMLTTGFTVASALHGIGPGKAVASSEPIKLDTQAPPETGPIQVKTQPKPPAPSPAAGEVAPETIVRTADGAVDPVQSALATMRQNATAPETDKGPTPTDTVQKSSIPADRPPIHQAVDNLAKAAADLQAALRGESPESARLKTPSEPTPQETKIETSQPPPGTEVPPASTASLAKETGTRDVPVPETATTKPLTPAAEGATKELSAPETITGGTDLTVTQEQTGSPALTSAIPAEKGSGPFRSAAPRKPLTPGITDADGLLYDIVGNHGKIPIFMPDGIVVAQYRKLSAKYKAGGFANMTPKERDLYRRLQETFPRDYEDNYGVNGEAIRAAYDAAKKAGIAGELFARTKSGHATGLDKLMDFVRRTRGEDYDPRALWSEIEAASSAHLDRKAGNTREAKILAVEEKQTTAFQRANNRPGNGTELIHPDEIQKDMTYTLDGVKLKVTDIQFDEDGRLTRIEVEDGKQFGVQRLDVEAGATIRADEGSLKVPTGKPALPRTLTSDEQAALRAELEALQPDELNDSAKLREHPTAENLDKNALQFYGRTYGKLSPDQQKEIHRATVDKEIPRRGKEGGSYGRPETAPAKQAAQRASGELQRPPAKTGVEEQSAKLSNPHPVDEQLRSMIKERAQLEIKYRNGTFKRQGATEVPQDSASVGALAQIRYLDGRIDALREIARATPELKGKYFEKFLEGDKPGEVDKVLDFLDSLKMDNRGRLHAFGLLPETWNALVDLVKLGVKGGRELANAVEWAINQFTLKNPGVKFDEEGARQFFNNKPERDWTHENTSPAKPERERTVDQVKADREAADKELKAAIKARLNPGEAKREDLRQAVAIATAKYRTLTDELLHHPDYVAEKIAEQHKALTEANAILEPQGMKVRPGEFPNTESLRGKIPDEQFERLRKFNEQIDSTHSELTRMPKKIVARIYSEMQDDGRLPKSKPMDVSAAGRTLDKVTDWLRANGVDSPRRSLIERLDLVNKAKDQWNDLKDYASKQWAKMMTASKAAVEIYKAPPKDDDFRSVIKSWIYADQRTGLETHQFVKTLISKIENPVRRQALSVWLDAGGDRGLLEAQRHAVPDRFSKIWEVALRLTPDEKALAEKIRADFEAKLEDGVKVGIVQKGREQYGVPQRWKIAPKGAENPDPYGEGKKGSPGRPNAKLDPRDPFFAFQREFPTYFDGIMNGGVPENLDVAHLVSIYDGAFHKALSSRGAIAALQLAYAKDGLPVVKISGAASAVNSSEGGKAYFVDSRKRNMSDVSEDGRPYRTLDHFALKDWKIAFKDDAGNPIFVKGDMLIHPDQFDYLKNELGTSALREGVQGAVLKPLLNAQAFLKASKLSASFFHLATIGEHMASHLANPFLNGFKIDLRQADQSLLVRNGLELGMSSPRMAFEEGLASGHGGLFGKVPFLGELSAKTTDWMFRDYIPTIMMKVGLHALENNRRRYGGKLSEDQIAELTAHQMNAAGGLQNYRLRGSDNNFWGKLGGNKTLMDINRMALLAPQFLEARARVVAQALKPYGHEQRKMLLVQAGLLYVGARVLNQLLDDDPHWHDNPFSVVFHGRAYSIRTIVGDFWHLLTDPKSFAAGRLSPASRLGIETITQRDLRTGARKEPPIQMEWMPGRVAQNAAVDIAKWLTPITVEGMLPGAAGREQTIPSMALASIGVGSRKFPAQNQMWELAGDFNRKSPDAAARRFQLQRDGDVHAEGAYRKLDALLDAGDLDGAEKEYQALVKDGHKPEAIRARYGAVFRPFTGNQDREAKFKKSLNEADRKKYDAAIEERKARLRAFNKLPKQRAAGAD